MKPIAPTVFYGLCGEGLGHFSRAAFLVPALLDAGYRVELFTSGRVADLCESRFNGCRVHRVPGLRLRYRDNRLAVLGTILNCMGMAARGPLASLAVARRAALCRPIAGISDYEPVVAWTAFALGLPLIALDHQQIATECEVEFASQARRFPWLLRLSNRMTYLRPTLRIMTSFFPAPLRARRPSDRRRVIGPVLRPEVLQRQSTHGDHVVIYQTSRTLSWLVQILNALPGEKRVYGTGTSQSGQTEQPFSEAAFLDDLASCRFALVNGGHTTISEALHFGKPLLCLPILGQAEQEMNAHQVAKLGFGFTCRADKNTVPDFGLFLRQEAAMRQRIAGERLRCGNDDLLRLVLSHLSAWRAGTPESTGGSARTGRSDL
jgi:uncharacterized protein (TIGR00661 family)